MVKPEARLSWRYHQKRFYVNLGFALYKKIFDELSLEGYKDYHVNIRGVFVEQKEMTKLYADNLLAIHISNLQYSILKQVKAV
jgi:hypothetical protein